MSKDFGGQKQAMRALATRNGHTLGRWDTYKSVGAGYAAYANCTRCGACAFVWTDGFEPACGSLKSLCEGRKS